MLFRSLNRTLIVLASEFSRDSLVEGKPDKKVKDQVPVPDKIEDLKNYGMHRHFTDAGSVLLFGGGIRRDTSTVSPPMSARARPSRIA